MDIENFLFGAGAGGVVGIVGIQMISGAELGGIVLVPFILGGMGLVGYLVGGGSGVLGALSTAATWWLYQNSVNAGLAAKSAAATAASAAAQAKCTSFVGQPTLPGQSLSPWMACMAQNGAPLTQVVS